MYETQKILKEQQRKHRYYGNKNYVISFCGQKKSNLIKETKKANMRWLSTKQLDREEYKKVKRTKRKTLSVAKRDVGQKVLRT